VENVDLKVQASQEFDQQVINEKPQVLHRLRSLALVGDSNVSTVPFLKILTTPSLSNLLLNDYEFVWPIPDIINLFTRSRNTLQKLALCCAPSSDQPDDGLINLFCHPTCESLVHLEFSGAGPTRQPLRITDQLLQFLTLSPQRQHLPFLQVLHLSHAALKSKDGVLADMILSRMASGIKMKLKRLRPRPFLAADECYSNERTQDGDIDDGAVAAGIPRRLKKISVQLVRDHESHAQDILRLTGISRFATYSSSIRSLNATSSFQVLGHSTPRPSRNRPQ
jgi:hypothetical protein